MKKKIDGKLAMSVVIALGAAINAFMTVLDERRQAADIEDLKDRVKLLENK